MQSNTIQDQSTMMTNEEKIIRELEGGKNPFRVPEGYFEDFGKRLTERLSEAGAENRTVRLIPRLWKYAAAIVLVAGVGAALYWSHSQTTPTRLVSQEEYYNEALDYIMVDNMEIAEYLTEVD